MEKEKQLFGKQVFTEPSRDNWASLVPQQLRIHPPVMQESQVQFLGREDPLEMEKETDSRILAWEIPWTEEPSKLESMASKESDKIYRINQPPPPQG